MKSSIERVKYMLIIKNYKQQKITNNKNLNNSIFSSLKTIESHLTYIHYYIISFYVFITIPSPLWPPRRRLHQARVTPVQYAGGRPKLTFQDLVLRDHFTRRYPISHHEYHSSFSRNLNPGFVGSYISERGTPTPRFCWDG